MKSTVKAYLAEIGRRGGRKSRRALDPETARAMVRVREARRWRLREIKKSAPRERGASLSLVRMDQLRS